VNAHNIQHIIPQQIKTKYPKHINENKQGKERKGKGGIVVIGGGTKETNKQTINQQTKQQAVN